VDSQVGVELAVELVMLDGARGIVSEHGRVLCNFGPDSLLVNSHGNLWCSLQGRRQGVNRVIETCHVAELLRLALLTLLPTNDLLLLRLELELLVVEVIEAVVGHGHHASSRAHLGQVCGAGVGTQATETTL